VDLQHTPARGKLRPTTQTSRSTRYRGAANTQLLLHMLKGVEVGSLTIKDSPAAPNYNSYPYVAGQTGSALCGFSSLPPSGAQRQPEPRR